MGKVTIRKAALDDLPLLLQFEQGVINAERPYDITLREDPITYYYLKRMVVSDEAEVVVAERKGEIIGSGHATIKKARHYLNHDYYFNLGFMYTIPKYRGKGVNLRIIETLKLWAKSIGFDEIRLTVYKDNLPLIKAYEKAGFKKHILEMRLG